MLAVFKATAPPQNLLKNTLETKVLFCSALKKHKPCLLIVPSKLRPWKDCIRTTKRVGAIGIVIMAAFATLGLRAPPRPLRSTRPRFRLETIVIMAATGYHVRKIETWARPPVTMVKRRGILLTNVSSPASQKNSIGLGVLLVNSWC